MRKVSWIYLGIVFIIFQYSPIYSQEVALAQTREGWGYIRKDGSWLIPPKYKLYDVDRSFNMYEANYNIDLFSEGMAAFADKDGWGFYNSNGEVAIAPTFDLALEFSESLAAVKEKGRWGFIDMKGNW